MGVRILTMKIDYDQEEKLIAEAIMDARKVQEYIWQDLSFTKKPYTDMMERWVIQFQKRVNKIIVIDTQTPNFKVELRKRLLQQAALSIAALKVLDNES